jgi:hypothetical protein
VVSGWTWLCSSSSCRRPPDSTFNCNSKLRLLLPWVLLGQRRQAVRVAQAQRLLPARAVLARMRGAQCAGTGTQAGVCMGYTAGLHTLRRHPFLAQDPFCLCAATGALACAATGLPAASGTLQRSRQCR